MAPRVDRRVARVFRQVGRAGRILRGSDGGQSANVVRNTETRSIIPKPEISCHSSIVKGAAAGRQRVDPSRHDPGGRLAQLVRALP